MEENYFASVYNIKDRLNLVVFRNVKFNEIKIGIPRCEKCLSVHNTVSIITTISIIIGILLVFVIPVAVAVWLDLSIVGIVIMLALTFGAVVLFVTQLEQLLLSSFRVPLLTASCDENRRKGNQTRHAEGK